MPHKITVTEEFTEVGVKNIDNRKRVPIGEAVSSALEGVSRVMIFQGEDGDILLRPIAEIPLNELWLYKNRKAHESLQRGLDDAAAGRVTKMDDSLLAPEEQECSKSRSRKKH